MWIVSLVPAATEIVCALGLGAQLVGVSHECDYPPAVQRLPRLTASTLPTGVSSAAIDAAVGSLLQAGESLYAVDEVALAACAPDLILTQALCEVCAVSYSDTCRAARLLERDPRIVSLEPLDLAGVFEAILAVGGLTGVPQRAAALIADLRARLQCVEAAVAGRPAPTVFALEWIDPPYAAGHWVPEQVARAGGHEVLGRPGGKSVRTTWEAVVASAPEVVLLIPCGYDAAGAQREFAAAGIADLPAWQGLPAVQNGRVYALDANAHFSRPGPRLVDGVDALARLLHPAAFASCAIEVSEWS